MTLHPDAEYKPHWPLFYGAWPWHFAHQAGLYIITHPDGVFCAKDPTSDAFERLFKAPSQPVQEWAIDPTATWFVALVADSEELQLFRSNGERQSIPCTSMVGHLPSRIFFDSSGEQLWIFHGQEGGRHFEVIQVLQTGSWTPIARGLCPAKSDTTAPQPNGPSGKPYLVFWDLEDGDIETATFLDMENGNIVSQDCGASVFYGLSVSPSGSEFLVFYEIQSRFARYAYPSLEELGQVPVGFGARENLPVYMSDVWALFRLEDEFVPFHTRSMRMGEPFRISGNGTDEGVVSRDELDIEGICGDYLMLRSRESLVLLSVPRLLDAIAPSA